MVEKLCHRADDFGVVIKKHLKDGVEKTEYGMEKMERELLEKKHFYLRFKMD